VGFLVPIRQVARPYRRVTDRDGIAVDSTALAMRACNASIAVRPQRPSISSSFITPIGAVYSTGPTLHALALAPIYDQCSVCRSNGFCKGANEDCTWSGCQDPLLLRCIDTDQCLSLSRSTPPPDPTACRSTSNN